MENKITQAAKFIKWWAALPPGKKLVTYLLSGTIAVFLVSSVIVKTLYRQTISDNKDTKNQLNNCEEDKKKMQAAMDQLQADFRNYLIQDNRRKENGIIETDSIIKVVKSQNH